MKNPRPVGWIGTVGAGVVGGVLTAGFIAILNVALPPAASVWNGLKSLPGAVWAGLIADVPVPVWIALVITFNLAWALIWWWRDRTRLFELEYPKPGSGELTKSQLTVLQVLAAAKDQTFTARQIDEALWLAPPR